MNFYKNISSLILDKAKQIKLFILDVDGVLSDGRIFITANGEEIKSFHTLDGHGLKMIQSVGIQTAIITGRDAPSVAFRAKQLGINHYFAGIHDKKTCFENLLQQCGFQANQCAYMGDDIVDLPVMMHVGLSLCPPESHPLVLHHADYMSNAHAGLGAVREVCDIILHAQNHYQSLINIYTK